MTPIQRAAEQMTLTVLATGLAQAVAKDNDDPDGHDIASGLFGPAVSEWLRGVVKELAPAAEQAEPVAWALTKQLEKRETTTNGYLWFSDPQNSSWEPLYRKAPAPARQEWQPIETAPKTGAKIIVRYVNRNNKPRTVMARWLTDEQAEETDADGVGLKGGWYECIDNWDDYTEVAIHEGEPSLWMPLPAAPITAAPAEGGAA